MSTRGMDHAELQAAVQRAAAAVPAPHQHTFRFLAPSRLIAGWSVLRCTKCPRIVTRRQEAS